MPKFIDKDTLQKLVEALDNRAKASNAELRAAIDTKANANHAHDDRYYTEEEINTKLSTLESTVNTAISKKADKNHGTHVTYSTTVPKAAGTASVGSESSVARGDHVHPAPAAIEGNAGSATKLETKRSITIGNQSNDFDGSANITYTLAKIGAAPIDHSHDGDFCSKTEFDAKITELNNAIDTKANIDHGTHVPTPQTANNAIFLRNDNTWQVVSPIDIGAAEKNHGEHVTYSTTVPKAAGTASTGSEAKVARADHVHPVQTSVSGNAGTATKLATKRSITIGNQSNDFDGSANIAFTVADIGAAPTSHNHDNRYYTESEIDIKLANLQSEIDTDVKVETDRALEAENALQAAIDKKANDNHSHPSLYYTISTIDDKLEGKSDVDHSHDDVYYTETEIDAKITTLNNAINSKASATHGNHVPSPQTANNAIFLRNDNTWQKVTPANIGAAASSHGTHVTYATAVPLAAGTAAVGTSSKVAREDHVHPAPEAIEGNAGSADKLSTPRTITIGSKGKVFDGSENVSWSLSEIGAAAASHAHDDKYYTESEIDIKITNLQSEIDADVEVEADRAKAAEVALQANIDKKANASHGNHVPATQTASNKVFLRNDNTWATVTPANIGAAASSHSHDDVYYTETEIDAKITTLNNTINGKANASHGNHVPTTQTANNAIFLRNDNTWATVTPANIGAAASSHGTHVTYATAAPLANGTASVGTSSKVAREDHVHPAPETIEGNAGSADKLSTPRTITIGNKGKTFDGSENISWTLSEIGAAASSHAHDDKYYTESEIDTKVSDLQAEIDADVKVEADRAKAAENTLQANIDKKANASHGNHVPTTQTASNKVFLRNDNTWQTITPANIGAAASSHTHDDRYYTETEIDAKITTLNTAIDGKANTSHGNHVPATQTASNKVFLRNDNTWATITPANIGAAASSHGTHVTYATAAPLANGTAAVGTSSKVAREDHVHPAPETIEGNAGSADKLSTARTLTIGNTGKTFDGSENVAWSLSEIGAAASSHTHDGRYYTESEINTKVTNLQAEIDADVKVEADRAKEAEVALQANIDKKADSGHTHDDRYYTESEINTKLSGKSDTSHTHDGRYYTEAEIDAKVTTLNSSIATAKSDAQSYADTKIAALVNSAPDAMNTLSELATAITDHQDVYDAYVEEVTSKLAGKSDTGHTHKYAGSSSAGGAATSANKVNSNLVVKLNSGSTEGTNLFTFNGSAAKTINITPSSIGAAASSHGTHVTYATATPSANGTAAVGSSAKVAREDHVHPLQTTVSGNAGTATKLATARNITIGNKTNSFDGSANISFTLADIGAATSDHNHDSVYSKTSHTHKYAGSSSAGGAANSATKLATARTITVNGVVSGSTSFDGSSNVTITTTANDITTITKSLQVTADWMDVGITGTDLESGTYAVQLHLNGGGQGSIYEEYFSGIMSWFSGTTNSTDADEIFLHAAGHATNGKSMYLRTARTASSGKLKLQIATDTAFTAAVECVLKFKKLI